MKRLYVASFLLTAIVLGNAYQKKKHFYPMMVYVTRSNSSLAVILLQVIMLFPIVGDFFGRLAFGDFSLNEMDILRERAWFIFTDSCFTFATFKNEYEPKFAALLYIFLFFKCAHVLAEERITFIERSPVVPSLFHFRMISVIVALFVFDLMLIRSAVGELMSRGLTWHMAFGIEYSILLIAIVSVAVKYLLHYLEVSRAIPRVTKEMCLLYADVLLGVAKMTMYACCGVTFLANQGAPFFLFRPVLTTYESISKALLAIILSRRAVRVMDALFPNASAQDLAAFDNVCIICREDLTEGGESKKLPCNHIFHRSCLRLWFNRQQNCPTCRKNLLNVAPVEPPEEGHSNPTVRNNVNQFNNNSIPEPGPSISLEVNNDQCSGNENNSSLKNSIYDLKTLEELEGLSEEELKELSLKSKKVLIEKIKVLKRIQRLVDSSILMMSKYCDFIDEQIVNETNTDCADQESANASQSQPTFPEDVES